LSAVGSQQLTVPSSLRLRRVAAQVPVQRHGTLKVASSSVARQPAMRHEPSSWLKSGSKLLAREFVQPRNQLSQSPSSNPALGS